MAIPDFQTAMRPLLAQYEDGQERTISAVRDKLAQEFGLSPEELEERIPSGRAKTFQNRVGWAVTYLYRTGLLDRPKRSVYRITERGRTVFQQNPERIDLGVLRQFDEFRKPASPAKGAFLAETILEGTTPEETIDAAYGEYRRALIEELLDRVRLQSPLFFEQLVLDVLLAMGYGGSRQEAGERLGRSGDAGLDGVIREDRLGLDVIYLQAKRWENTVGRPTIQAFVGALQGARASKGVLITSSNFSSEAQSYADSVSPRVILVDGPTLAGLMVDHDVGVTPTPPYVLKRIDEDYFELDEGTGIDPATLENGEG